MLLTAMCDNTSSTLMSIALLYIPASIFQMSRGFIVFTTSTLSVIFLKKKLYVHHKTAIALIVGGILTVGIAAMLQKGEVSY